MRRCSTPVPPIPKGTKMAITRRARKRIAILLVGGLALVVAGFLVREYRRSLKDQRAVEAKEIGLRAAESGDWELALGELSYAVGRFQSDADTLLVFADARSRVPMENDRHIGSALNLYVKAVELCRRLDLPREKMILAMAGRGRLEGALGQIARLKKSSLELLAFDPGNRQALEQLQAIQLSTGNLLPSNVPNFVRGDRTNEEWVADLRVLGDESALRWMLEKILVGFNAERNMANILEILSAGKSAEIQQAQRGRIQESAIDLLMNWKSEGTLREELADLFIVREMLRENRQEEASFLLEQVNLDDMDDPENLLLAANLYDSLASDGSRRRAAELLAKASKVVSDKPEMMLQLAIRNWNDGRSDECFELLNRARDAMPEEKGIKIDALILAAIGEETRIEDWRADLDELLADPGLDATSYERGLAVKKVLELKGSNDIDPVEVRNLCGNFGKWISDPLMLCLLGDLARQAGVNGLAVKAYRNASKVIGGISLPITSRLITELQRQGSYIEGFREALRFANSSRSIQGIFILANAWVNLEAVGVSAKDVDPLFGGFSSPVELVAQLEEEVKARGEDAGFLQPLVVKTIFLNGDREKTAAKINQILTSGVNVNVAGQLVRIAIREKIEITDSVIEYLTSQDKYIELMDSLTEAIAAKMQDAGDLLGAVEFLEEKLTGRDDQFANRLLGFALLRLAGEDRDIASRGFDRVFESPIDRRDIKRLMRIAIDFEDGAMAFRIIDRVKAEFGNGTREMAIAGGLYAIAFLLQDEDKVVEAIGRIDPVVSSGESNAGIDAALARLLTQGPPSTRNITRAIEVLLGSVERHPEQISNLLFLIELLQQAGRFAEADEFITQGYRRRSATTPSQQAQIATFLSRQGRIADLATSICEIAALSNRVEDLFRCFEVQLSIGNLVEADRMLDDLSVRPDSTPNIAVAIANRFIRRNDPEAAIEHLENSVAFKTEIDRSVQLVQLLMGLGDWAGAGALLESSLEEYPESGEANLLLAIISLRQTERDLETARAALNRVAQLHPENAGFLRRTATIAMNAPELRGEARKFIDLLAAINPRQADIMMLADDFYNLPVQEAVPEQLLVRAQTIVERNKSERISWLLYFDVLSATFMRAQQAGDVEKVDETVALLEDVLLDFANQFPNNENALNRMSQVQMQIGNPDEAALLARGALNAISRPLVLGDVLDLIRAEFLAGHYDLVLMAFSPFRDEIEANPRARPASWELLFAALLLDDQIETARELYVNGPIVADPPSRRWLQWLVAAENASPEIAIEANRIVLAEMMDPVDWELVLASLTTAYRRTGSREIHDEIEMILEQMKVRGKSGIADLKRRFAGIELKAIDDAVSSVLLASELQRDISAHRYPQVDLSDAADGLEGEEAKQYLNTIVLLLNNFVARYSDVVTSGELVASQDPEVVASVREAEMILARLLPMNPQVLDTRARFRLAEGRLDEGMELIGEAIKLNPASGVFFLTRAELLLAGGDRQGAAEDARHALRCTDYRWPVDEELVGEITQLLERIRSTVRLKTEDTRKSIV